MGWCVDDELVESTVAHCARAKVKTNAAPRLELGTDVNSDGVPLLDIERKLSVRDGDGRPRARPTVLHTIDHIAIFPGRKARLETRVPVLVRVVDRHKPNVSTSKRDALGSR